MKIRSVFFIFIFMSFYAFSDSAPIDALGIKLNSSLASDVSKLYDLKMIDEYNYSFIEDKKIKGLEKVYLFVRHDKVKSITLEFNKNERNYLNDEVYSKYNSISNDSAGNLNAVLKGDNLFILVTHSMKNPSYYISYVDRDYLNTYTSVTLLYYPIHIYNMLSLIYNTAISLKGIYNLRSIKYSY